MRRIGRLRAVSIHSLVLLAILAVMPGDLFAQASPIGIPENAHSKSYGGGWECNRGYRQVNRACSVIKLPTNAYLTDSSYGQGWECSWGYYCSAKRERGTCDSTVGIKAVELEERVLNGLKDILLGNDDLIEAFATELRQLVGQFQCETQTRVFGVGFATGTNAPKEHPR